MLWSVGVREGEGVVAFSFCLIFFLDFPTTHTFGELISCSVCWAFATSVIEDGYTGTE